MYSGPAVSLRFFKSFLRPRQTSIPAGSKPCTIILTGEKIIRLFTEIYTKTGKIRFMAYNGKGKLLFTVTL
jgi:hypothetical protein